MRRKVERVRERAESTAEGTQSLAEEQAAPMADAERSQFWRGVSRKGRHVERSQFVIRTPPGKRGRTKPISGVGWSGVGKVRNEANFGRAAHLEASQTTRWQAKAPAPPGFQLHCNRPGAGFRGRIGRKPLKDNGETNGWRARLVEVCPVPRRRRSFFLPPSPIRRKL